MLRSVSVKTSPPNPEQDPIANRESPAPEQVPQWVVLAQLLRPQGRKGEILAELYTDFPERFDTQKRVFLAPTNFTGPEAAARIAEVAAYWLPVGKNEGRIVLHFTGIDSINAAEPFAGLEVIVPATERVELDDEDANYISDLIGCTVFDLADPSQPVSIGIITDVQFATTPDGSRRLEDAAPLLAIETAVGDEVLVPFAKAFLVSLDPGHKRIEMSLPPWPPRRKSFLALPVAAASVAVHSSRGDSGHRSRLPGPERMTAPRCKKCGSERTNRTERKGFFQQVLMTKLGRFPWECRSCWKIFYSMERGKRTRRRATPAESATPLNPHISP